MTLGGGREDCRYILLEMIKGQIFYYYSLNIFICCPPSSDNWDFVVQKFCNVGNHLNCTGLWAWSQQVSDCHMLKEDVWWPLSPGQCSCNWGCFRTAFFCRCRCSAFRGHFWGPYFGNPVCSLLWHRSFIFLVPQCYGSSSEEHEVASVELVICHGLSNP